jgi:hypothetical protein
MLSFFTPPTFFNIPYIFITLFVFYSLLQFGGSDPDHFFVLYDIFSLKFPSAWIFQ